LSRAASGVIILIMSALFPDTHPAAEAVLVDLLRKPAIISSLKFQL
jgi:hypothetical protein